jgi:hypothetical protein
MNKYFSLLINSTALLFLEYIIMMEMMKSEPYTNWFNGFDVVISSISRVRSLNGRLVPKKMEKIKTANEIFAIFS